MKIKTLHIKGHKNLEDARFEHTGDLIAIIGNNGCGKSNLLEAISCIFKNLYKNEKNIPFDFYLEYVTSDNNKVEIEKEKSKLSFRVDNVTHVGINDFLPKKVVAIYSGEEDRLWKQYYRPFYLDYISNINRERHASLPQMLYLNKFYWNIALLCLSLSENNKEFLEQTLGIYKIDKIKFEFTKSNYEDFNNSPALHLVKTLDDQTEHTFEDLSTLLNLRYSVDEIFSYLYIAFTPDKKKIINDITVMFNDGLTIEDLSEGQKKLLLLKAALEFAGQEDTLYLLDEPDAHVHVNNKNKVIDALKPYIHNRQVIVTTHSPTITQCVDEKNLLMMSSGSFIPRNQQEIIEEITGEFWNAHQQNSFLASKRNIILLVEGKHDKEHILNAHKKLKEEFPSLDFDVFSFGGESKIQPFMQGLAESGEFREKIYITIYDNDGAGQAAYQNGKHFEKGMNDCMYRKFKTDTQIVHDNLFACLLPKPDGYTKDCTIENMFDSAKYMKAYQEALQNNLRYFENKPISEIGENIQSNAKNILMNDSKDFEKDDFKNFRALFHLILQIKNRDSQQDVANASSPDISIPTDIPSSIMGNEEITEENENVIFTLKRGGADAKAIYDFENNTIKILTGSKIRKQEIPSFKQNTMRRDERNNKLKRINKIIDGEAYVLNQEIEFNNLREAILFCTTTNLNTKTWWFDKNGKSLAEYIDEYNKQDII